MGNSAVTLCTGCTGYHKAQTCDETWTFPATLVCCAHVSQKPCHPFADDVSHHDYDFKQLLRTSQRSLSNQSSCLGQGRSSSPQAWNFDRKALCSACWSLPLLETIDVHSTCNMDVASIVLDCSIVAQYKAEHCFYNPGESRTQIQRFLHVEREVRITCPS